MTIGMIIGELCLIWLVRKYFAQNFILLFSRVIGSRNGAIWIYSIVTLPGVLTHEIAHFLTAAILGLRTGKIELLPSLHNSGNLEFGSVQVEKVDPVRLSLVGLAPILAGLPLVAWMSLEFPKNQWLWGYLIVCLTIHLLPSKQDLRYWPVIVIMVGLIIWAGLKITGDSFLLTSMTRGLMIPLLVLTIGSGVLMAINRLMFRRRIVQYP